MVVLLYLFFVRYPVRDIWSEIQKLAIRFGQSVSQSVSESVVFDICLILYAPPKAYVLCVCWSFLSGIYRSRWRKTRENRVEHQQSRNPITKLTSFSYVV